MQRTISLFLLLTIPFLTFSFNYPYKRLNKLYQSEDEKCLTTAKRFIKYFPNNPAPYYFAMTVHYDQAQQQETPRKKYNELTKALGYARKYTKVNDDEFDSKVSWDDKASAMNVFTEEVIAELKEAKLRQLRKQLISKRKRLKWEKVKAPRKRDDEIESSPVVEVLEITEVKPAKPSIPVSSRVEGQCYGLASGSELIPSHNGASEKELLALINAERKKKGMGALVWDEDLAKAARYHAYDMGTQEYFDHESKDRIGNKAVKVAGTFERIKKFYTASFANSENIAAGNESANATYLQWYHSPGHYKNMFNADSKKVGIGVVYSPDSPYGYYWVFDSAL